MEGQYNDIEELYNKQNDLLQQQQNKQNEIVQQQTDMQVAELEKNKQDIQKETDKTTKGLYSEYQKQVNPYGAQAEQLASQGLANTGFAESSKVALYNTYQKNVTETLNNATKLKTDVDFQINQAKQQGNILAAQNALELYKQQAQMLIQNYELKENRNKFLYQQERDRVADTQWQKTFDEQLRQNELEEGWRQKNDAYQRERDKVSDNQWQKTYDENVRQYNEGMAYQKERDKVSDNQWYQQYLLSKKKVTSSQKKTTAIAKDDTKQSKEDDENASTVTKISDDTILVKYTDANGKRQGTTLTITDKATPEQVIKWGQKYGVDLTGLV